MKKILYAFLALFATALPTQARFSDYPSLSAAVPEQSFKLAGIYWLPDYLKDNIDTNHRTDTAPAGSGDRHDLTCSVYGGCLGIPANTVCTESFTADGKTVINPAPANQDTSASAREIFARAVTTPATVWQTKPLYLWLPKNMQTAHPNAKPATPTIAATILRLRRLTAAKLIFQTVLPSVRLLILTTAISVPLSPRPTVVKNISATALPNVRRPIPITAGTTAPNLRPRLVPMAAPREKSILTAPLNVPSAAKPPAKPAGI